MTLRLLTSILLVACTHAPEPKLVFVCEHGAAKSVVATAYFNQLAAARGLEVRAIARGAEPQAKLSVAAVRGLEGDGLATKLEAPRPLTAAERDGARVVAFDCAQPAMRGLAGAATCWDDVPAISGDYARAREVIRAHVAELVDQWAARSTR